MLHSDKRHARALDSFVPRHSVDRGGSAYQCQSVTRPHLHHPGRMSNGGEKRLRLRLRVADSSQRYKVGVPAACTLQQLQSAVRVELPTLDADFGISLNKKTMLQDPGAMLTALGICSGDLLWVHPPAGTAVLMDCDRQSVTPAAAAPAVPARELLAAAVPTSQPPARQAAADAAEARRRAAMQAASKRQKAEDVHETPAMADAAGLPVRVPANRLLVPMTGDGILQLAAAVHAVALDCGLDGVHELQAEGEELPVCSQPSAGSFSLRYRLAGIAADAAGAVATVQCSRMGDHVLAAGRAASADGAAAGSVHHTTVRWQPANQPDAAHPPDAPTTAAAGRPDAAQRIPLDRLLQDAAGFVTLLKDGMVLPLVADLCRAAGVSPPSGLLSLPPELRRSVMDLLGAKDLARLACVCAELRDVASVNDLWRPLFEVEFGQASLAEATAGACGWKSLFRTRWLHREEYRSARHRPMRLPFMGVPPHPLHRGGTRPPGTPFIIGGDADRLPLPFQPFGGRRGGSQGGRGGRGMFGGSL